jgi:DNA repair protein SbcC/Rad50
MMLLKTVRLKNVRSYTDEKIVFPLGSSLLSGDIGCGKSTILLAVDFAIFGIRKGELSGTDILRHGKNDGLVELEMELDGKNIIISRSLKRGSSITQECSLTINRVKEKLTPVEIKARMLEMLGYPMELIKKNKPIFRYTVYAPQEEMKKILSDEDDRLEILRKIFNIDKYGTIRENSRMLLTEIRSMTRELDAIASDLDLKISERNEAEKSKDGLEKKMLEFEKMLDLINRDYAQKKEKSDQLKTEIEKLRKAQVAQARLETEIRNFEKKINDITTEIHSIDSKIKFNLGLLPQIDAENFNGIADKIKSTERERDGILKKIAVFDTEIEKMMVIFSKGVCSFCGQNVTDPKAYGAHIEERKIGRKELLQKIEEQDSLLQEMKNQKDSFEKYIAIRRSIDDLKSWKDDKARESERSLDSLAKTKEDLAAIKKDAVIGADLDIDFKNIESEISEIYKRKIDAEKSLSRTEQQREDLQRRITSLAGEILQKEAAKKKREKAGATLAWMDKFILLMETIEKHVLLTVQKEFDSYFQYWFAMLMGDTLAVRIDDRFKPVIEQNGFETTFENLSGGEKTAVSLAYRLALNKVINIMISTIRTKDLLILDEPTDGFSSDQLDKVRDVIAALDLKQVILVSHEPKIDTYVQNVIRIYKENHVSKVVSS